MEQTHLMQEQGLTKKEMEMSNSGGIQKETIKFLILTTTIMLSSTAVIIGSSLTPDKSGFFLELQEFHKHTSTMLNFSLKKCWEKKTTMLMRDG